MNEHEEKSLTLTLEPSNPEDMNVTIIKKFIERRHWTIAEFVRQLAKVPATKDEDYVFSYGHIMNVFDSKRPLTSRLKNGFNKLKERV